MTDIVHSKFSKIVFLLRESPDGTISGSVHRLLRPQSDAGLEARHGADLIVEIKNDGRTEVLKNRYGDRGQVTPDAPVQDLNSLADDLKKFLGLAPYNTQSNHCWGDTYFGHSLERRYGKNITTLRGLVGL